MSDVGKADAGLVETVAAVDEQEMSDQDTLLQDVVGPKKYVRLA
jgi:hypothetical protein